MESYSYKVVVFKSCNEYLSNMMQSGRLKYIKKINRDKDIYLEYILSFEDILEQLNEVMKKADSDPNLLFNVLDQISKNLCRIIYNTKEEILFIITSQISLWSEFAKSEKMGKMELINKKTLERLSLNQIHNLVEIELDTLINGEKQSIILSGHFLEVNIKFREYFENIIDVYRYVRELEGGTIEINCENTIKVTGIERKDIAKILNKSVVKE